MQRKCEEDKKNKDCLFQDTADKFFKDAAEHKNQSKKPHLSLFHVNINSLKLKVQELEKLLTKHKIDIVCLTEHRMVKTGLQNLNSSPENETNIITSTKKHTTHDQNFKKYKIISSYCRQKTETRVWGGSCILVKNEISEKWEKIKDEELSEHANDNFEICGMKNSETAVYCIYRRPKRKNNQIQDFTNRMDQFLNCELTHPKEVIVAGDFNINLITTEDSLIEPYLKNKSTNNDDDDESKFIEVFTKRSFKKLISEPTRGVKCLDNIFIKTFRTPDSYKAYNRPCKRASGDTLSDHFGQLLRFYDFKN